MSELQKETHMHIPKRLSSLVLFTFVVVFTVSTCWAESKPSGRVDAIDPDHQNVLGLVGRGLQDRHVGLGSVETGTNDLLSNYEEFRAHLLVYRARFRFHLEGTSIIVTMENLESPGKGTWTRSLIPADGAEAKLIAQVVDQLNAAKQRLVNSSDRAGSKPGLDFADSHYGSVADGATGHNSPKTLVFDPVPVRCAEGVCPVRRDGLWGFIDYNGNVVLDFQFHSDDVPYFSDGVGLVRSADSNNRMLPGHVYIDKKGKVLFDGRIFQSARPFVNGFAIVEIAEKKRNGWNTVTVVLDHQGQVVPIGGVSQNADFHDGLIAARGEAPGNGKAGFRDSKGHWAIPPLYQEVQAFSDGAAWVEQITVGGIPKWGAIDTKGQAVVPFEFSRAPEPYSEGLAVVFCSHDTKGYVNKAGALVLPCQYQQAYPFLHGRALVVDRAGRRLLIDERGQIAFEGNRLGLIPAGVSSITRQDDGRFQFVEAYTGSLDETWSTRIQPKFTGIGLFPVDQDPRGVAWASAPTGQQGFINRRGEFVVIQQQSKF